jgi:hypothetical protein
MDGKSDRILKPLQRGISTVVGRKALITRDRDDEVKITLKWLTLFP